MHKSLLINFISTSIYKKTGNNVVALYTEIETWGYPKADMQQNEQVSLEDHPHLASTPTIPNGVFKCCSLEICRRVIHLKM